MVSVKRRHEESSFKRAAFFVSSFVFPEYQRKSSFLDGAEKTKINKNRRKYMEDTKKTVLAGNGEKDVPRAVYDGVLTIDVDAQVESMEEQEEARWHQLLNAHRTRKTISSVTAALIPDDKIEIVTTSMISLYVRFPFSNVPFVKNI